MKKLLSGPMATLSHEGFRRIIQHFGGVDEHYTEMINAPSLLHMGPFEKYYIMNQTCPEKIVWQLTGKDAEPMARAAEFLCSLGGIGLDINMGCSAPEIYKSGAGIAWMLKPRKETLEMVRGVKKAIESSGSQKPVRLSVKLRLGDEDFVPESFFDFCEALSDCGVQQFVLHPRTKKEKLSRPPRWHFVQTLALRMKDKGISVILNGNVTDVNSAENALKTCPDVDGIMISRMAAVKPWIFYQLKNELKDYFDEPLDMDGTFEKGEDGKLKVDRMQIGLEYIENLETTQPPEFFKTRMQRFFAYYCDNFSFGHYIKSKMLNCTQKKEAVNTFTAYFDEVPSDRFIYI